MMSLGMSSRHEGKFCKVFQVDLQDQVYNRSKYQKIQSKIYGFYQKECRLWQDTSLGARHTSSMVDITLDSWCNQSRRTNQVTYMV